MKYSTTLTFCAIFMYAVNHSAAAATYAVGPEKTYSSLQDVTGRLKSGDTVMVDGNETYPSGVRISENGTDDNWIVIRGSMPAGGSRPRISGATRGIRRTRKSYSRFGDTAAK